MPGERTDVGAAARAYAGSTQARAAESAAAETFSTSRTQRWKLTLAYDGTAFSGWQVQPGRPTIQRTLAEALKQLTGERVLPQGSGRTDAGVHALGQVASFDLRAPIPARNLQSALNRALPAAIRILLAEPVAADFHARHSARSKLYEYRIWRRELCPPWTAPYVYACPWPLSIEAMQEAAALVLGEHDFTSFTARKPDLTARSRALPARQSSGEQAAEASLGSSLPASLDISLNVMAGHPDEESDPAFAAKAESRVRRLLSSAWEQPDRQQPEPDLLCYRVRGSGFLHHMVRNLVGTFLDVGRGRISPAQLPDILAARDRSAAGSTAPARGLFLHSVEY